MWGGLFVSNTNSNIATLIDTAKSFKINNMNYRFRLPQHVWKGPLRKKWPFLYPFSHCQRMYPPRERSVSPDQGPKAPRVVTAFDMSQLQVVWPAKTGEWSSNLPGSCGLRHQPSASMGLKATSRIRPREPSTSRWQWNAGSDARRDFRRRGSGHPPFRHRRWWPGRASAWCSPGAATWPAWPPADPCASGP
ncbi:hypothetical protein D3C78_250440 [compost metagenome]